MAIFLHYNLKELSRRFKRVGGGGGVRGAYVYGNTGTR